MKRLDLEQLARGKVASLRAQAESLEGRADWIEGKIREQDWDRLVRAGVLCREDVDGSMTVLRPEAPHAP